MASIDHSETDIRADLEEVCRLLAEGKRVTDPELLRRIRERGDEVRREVFEKHGVLNVAVDLIREGRDAGVGSPRNQRGGPG
jgi:hypothetical protein